MTTISTLVALPYEIARRPFVMVDQQLSTKLSETSRPRVTLDRALGTADKLAGALLANRAIAERGAERIERSDKLVTAARLEDAAATRRVQADELASSGRREAADRRRVAQARAASGLDEAADAEATGKLKAKAQATKKAAAKKAAADQRAETRARAVEQDKKSAASAAEAKKQTARRTAKAELDDARETTKAATETRADAERLADLARVKKQQRKQS